MIDVNLPLITQVDNKLRVVNTPYGYAVAEGNLPGHVFFGKMGYLPATAAATYAVWNVAADYVFPATPIQMEVYSTDNTNDKAAGTGAWTVRIDYLDWFYKEKYEIVAVNGNTEVPTVNTDIYRVNGFRVNTAGTTGAATGTISLRAVADTPIYDQIAVGNAKSRTTVYTVPANKILYLTSLMASSGYSTTGKQILVTLRATYDDMTKAQTIGKLFLPYFQCVLMDDIVNKDFVIPLKFPGTTDIKAVASGETNARVTVNLSGWIEPE